MTEQPIALKTTLKGLWRHRLLVGVLAFAGLAAGVAYATTHPENPRAATLVLLPPSTVSSTGVAVRDMKTETVVATSNPVLAEASHAVRPAVSVKGLKRDVSVQAVSDQVLQIQVAEPRAGDAVALANAVASSYIHFASRVVPSAAEGGPGQILQPAVSALPASKLHTPMMGGIGLGAGLLAGLILAMALSNRDRRLRTRDEISRAIGVPVLASLEAAPCRNVGQWRRVLAEFVAPPAIAWTLRRLLHRLAPVGAELVPDIRVIAFSEDRAALAGAAQLARVAASLGIPTTLVPGEAAATAQLRAACAVNEECSHDRQRLELRLTRCKPGDPPERECADQGPDGRQLTVHLLVVDRASPHVQPFDGANIVSLSAGFATADELAQLALAAAESTQAIDGIVVVNPEPRDATAGIAGESGRQLVISRVNRPSGVEQAGRRVT